MKRNERVFLFCFQFYPYSSEYFSPFIVKPKRLIPSSFTHTRVDIVLSLHDGVRHHTNLLSELIRYPTFLWVETIFIRRGTFFPSKCFVRKLSLLIVNLENLFSTSFFDPIKPIERVVVECEMSGSKRKLMIDVMQFVNAKELLLKKNKGKGKWLETPRESVLINDEPRVCVQDSFKSFPEGHTLFFPEDASSFADPDSLALILNSFSLRADDTRMDGLKDKALLDFESTQIFQVTFFLIVF